MRDETPSIYAAAGVTLPLATIALALRMVARRITKAGYGWDDAFAAVGWLGAVGILTNGLVWIGNGLGRPMEEGLSDDYTYDDKLRTAWLQLWLTSFTYTFAIAFSKFAILTFYWRIFQYSDIRIPIQILSVVTVGWFILRLFLVTLQCIPINALWDLAGAARAAKCHVHESTFFFSTVLTHVLLDCAILALPAIEVGKLHLPKGQKVAVILLFMFGIMTCLASIFVLVASFRFESDSKEMNLQFAQHYAWSIVECNFAVIAGCLPMLRPVVRRCLPGSFLGSDGKSEPISLPFSNGINLDGAYTQTISNDHDGSSSTHELANSDAGPPDFEAGDWSHAMQAHISSPWRKYTSPKDLEDCEQGIRVHNEPAVKIDRSG
ncbi:hypothetical protein FZEAL_7644 [Fusarium zealandicum]|uniref:Rhodopsin domain-containing protein n=1 Tax=Fusarium zealandicum TaxID=1053134 RepID=A0A8H4XIG1_9HYPO|nr:hypothetical protein FZEAL_7644 [Fusarium zealandicum]